MIAFFATSTTRFAWDSFRDASLLFNTSAGTETAAPEVTQIASVSLLLNPAKISISPKIIFGETPATFWPVSLRIWTEPFCKIKQFEVMEVLPEIGTLLTSTASDKNGSFLFLVLCKNKNSIQELEKLNITFKEYLQKWVQKLLQ